MCELPASSFSPCGHAINIEHRPFINFRNFGKINEGDSATYTFLQHASHSTPTTTPTPLTGKLQFFWTFGPGVLCSSQALCICGAGVSTAKHAFVSIDSSPLPFSSTSDWLPSCRTCCVIGVLYLVSSVSFSCTFSRIPTGSSLLASVP